MFEQLVETIKANVVKNNGLKINAYIMTKDHKNHAIIFTIDNGGFIIYDDGSYGLIDNLEDNQ